MYKVVVKIFLLLAVVSFVMGTLPVTLPAMVGTFLLLYAFANIVAVAFVFVIGAFLFWFFTH